MDSEVNQVALPDDSQTLKAMLRALMNERDMKSQLAEEQTRRANDLEVENLRLQLELDKYKKWYYGPRADRLQSSADLTQMLLIYARGAESFFIYVIRCGNNVKYQFDIITHFFLRS